MRKRLALAVHYPAVELPVPEQAAQQPRGVGVEIRILDPHPVRKQMPEKLPQQLRLAGELHPAVIVVLGELAKPALFERLKLGLSGGLPLQAQLLFPYLQPQVGLGLLFNPGGSRAESEVAQSLLPKGYLLRAPPPGHPLFDRAQIGHRLHELGNAQLPLRQGIGDVEPELLFVGGKRWPDLQSIPSIARQGKAHLLEIPHGDAPAFLAAAKCRVNAGDKFRFLSSQIPTQRDR